MPLIVLIVVVMIVAAIAVASGVLDGPRRTRRRVVVREPDVIVERAPQTVVTERTVTTERDPLL